MKICLVYTLSFPWMIVNHWTIKIVPYEVEHYVSRETRDSIPKKNLLYHSPISIASTRGTIINHWTIKIVHYEVERYVSRETRDSIPTKRHCVSLRFAYNRYSFSIMYPALRFIRIFLKRTSYSLLLFHEKQEKN